MDIHIIPEEHYAREMEPVTAQLAQLRVSGYFTRQPDEKIYYELYSQENAKGWVALSHGFVEAAAKYAELIWYFFQAGYCVAICDHRGHGNSFREVKDLWLTHVRRFTDYCEDYHFFLEHIVVPKLNGLPLFLLGHSMGGAIAARTLELFPELPVRRLVLSSPMIAPQTQGFPKWTALLIARFFIAIGRGKACLFNHQVFTGQEDFGSDWCCATSYARYCWYLNVQRENPQYQNNAATYRWLEQALLIAGPLLKNAPSLRLPVLLLQAGEDTMVKNDAQEEFVTRLPDGRVERFPTARHEIFRSEDAIVRQFMEKVLAFFA